MWRNYTALLLTGPDQNLLWDKLHPIGTDDATLETHVRGRPIQSELLAMIDETPAVQGTPQSMRYSQWGEGGGQALYTIPACKTLRTRTHRTHGLGRIGGLGI